MVTQRTLSQVIAVLRHTRQKDNDEGSKIKKIFAKSELFEGSIKTYQPKDEDAPLEERVPNQEVAARFGAEDLLRQTEKYSIPAINTTATQDRTNCDAAADIVVGDTTIATKVPISHLLWLEDYLTELKNSLTPIPTLDAARRWVPASGRQWLFETAEPEVTVRDMKEEVPLVLHPGTDKHPPQVKTIMKATPIGTFSKTYFSGAVTEDRKRQILDRMHQIQAAVKDARERANRTQTIEETSEGQNIWAFLLNG